LAKERVPPQFSDEMGGKQGGAEGNWLGQSGGRGEPGLGRRGAGRPRSRYLLREGMRAKSGAKSSVGVRCADQRKRLVVRATDCICRRFVGAVMSGVEGRPRGRLALDLAIGRRGGLALPLVEKKQKDKGVAGAA